MKAVIVNEPFDVGLRDIPIPKPNGAFDVQLKITSGGICGSDIGIWNGTNALATYPRLIGHEFGGIVTAVGSGVTKVKPGDKAAVDPVVSCGSCYACRIGRSNVCGTLEVMGVHRDGGFAEYAVAHENNIYPVPPEVPDILLGLIEPYSIGMEINNRAQVTGADSVLILGAGPIGVCAMQVAKMRGAAVMMTDIAPERLDKALAMGADEVVLVSEEDINERLGSFTGGEGIPVVVDAVCTTASFEQAVELACPAGRVVCLGLKDKPSAIRMVDITKKELNILGSRLCNRCFGEVIDGIAAGKLTPAALCTHVFDAENAEDAFRLITERPGEVLKIVLTFN